MKRFYLILILLLSLAFIGFAQEGGKFTLINNGIDKHTLPPNGYGDNKLYEGINILFCIPVNSYNSDLHYTFCSDSVRFRIKLI